MRAWSWQRTPLIFNDGPVFLGLAELVDAGLWRQALAHPFHPLYPAAVRTLHRLAPDSLALGWEGAALAVSVLSGAAAVPLLFGVVDRILDRTSAWIAAAALALHPYAVLHAGDVQSDAPYLALFLAAVSLQWRALVGASPGRALAAGALAGAAYLVRPEGLGVAAVGVLAGLAGLGVREPAAFPLRRRMVWVAALLCGVALTAGPYFVHLRAQQGAWILTQKKSLGDIDAGAAPGGVRAWLEPEAARSLLVRHPFLDTVVRGPRVPAVPGVEFADGGPVHPGVARALGEGAAAIVAGLRPELLALLVLGIAGRRGRAGAGDAYLAGLALLYVAVLAGLAAGSGYVSKRHVVPLAALSLGHVAVGARLLGGRIAAGVSGSGAPRAGLGTVLALVLVTGLSLVKLARPRSFEALAERRAAEWVATRPDRGAGVAAGRQRLAYYADAPYVPLPGPMPGSASPRDESPILAYLRASGVRYVIADDRRIEAREGLGRALSRVARPVHEIEAGGRTARVFSLATGSPAPRPATPPATPLTTGAERD